MWWWWWARALEADTIGTLDMLVIFCKAFSLAVWSCNTSAVFCLFVCLIFFWFFLGGGSFVRCSTTTTRSRRLELTHVTAGSETATLCRPTTARDRDQGGKRWPHQAPTWELQGPRPGPPHILRGRWVSPFFCPICPNLLLTVFAYCDRENGGTVGPPEAIGECGLQGLRPCWVFNIDCLYLFVLFFFLKGWAVCL